MITVPLRKYMPFVALLVCVVAAQTRRGVFRIQPVRPVSELRVSALAAHAPVEQGSFRPSDLVALATLDSRIKLDIRYASSDNFLSTLSTPRRAASCSGLRRRHCCGHIASW